MSTLKELIQDNKLKLSIINCIEGNREWDTPNQGYRLRLKANNKTFTFPFYQGYGITHDPEIEGVLECLLSDASVPPDFEDFCSDFGYPRTQKHKKIHNACLRSREKLEKLLGESFESFLNCER